MFAADNGEHAYTQTSMWMAFVREHSAMTLAHI